MAVAVWQWLCDSCRLDFDPKIIGNVAVATWQWQYGSGNVAIWQWQCGNMAVAMWQHGSGSISVAVAVATWQCVQKF
jgi:hypothetical protein